MRDIEAGSEAREAAEHREHLKRAMEAAFATPTASAEEPHEEAPPPVLALQEAVAEAAVEIVDEEPPPVEIEEIETVAEKIAEPVTFVAEAPVSLVTEHPPAIELAEVEEQREHDIEILQWDVAKLVEGATEEEMPAVEQQVAEVSLEEKPAVIVAEDATPEPVTEEIAASAPKAPRQKKAKSPVKKKTATKKKAAPKKSADLPADAVWLSDAIAFSLKGEWSSVWTPPEDASGAERMELFREKAAAGELNVWGKAEGGDAYELVKPTYWKSAFVEPLSFLMGRENVVTEPKGSKAKKPVKYVGLKVAQSDIEALWPASTEAVRDAA